MRHLIFIIFLTLYSLTTWADQLIVEPNMGRTPLLDKINRANQSIELVIYGFTDQALLDAIVKQKQRGKNINIIIEGTPYKFTSENDSTIETLNRNHINWQGHIPPYRLIHQKTLIVDNRQAIVMTFNFTHSSFKNERNFALVIDNPSLVQAIDETFSADWEHQPTPTHHPDLIYSPDDSRSKLNALISNAKHSINIYAQNVNDFKIAGALAKAARDGVDINIITSSSLQDKQATYLTNAGVHLRQSHHLYIHAKVMIIDNNTAVVGSINFTHASIDNNRELSVITHDPKVIKQLNQVFAEDWQNTSNAISLYTSAPLLSALLKRI